MTDNEKDGRSDLLVVWGPKGGVGTSTIAAALAVFGSASRETTLVDMRGDQAPLLGIPQLLPANPVGQVKPRLTLKLEASAGKAAAEAGTDLVVVDAGNAGAGADVVFEATQNGRSERGAVHSICVTRACFLALNRLGRLDPSTRLVVISEAGRALRACDVASATGIPIWAQPATDPAVERAIDAGLFVSRMPLALRRPLRDRLDELLDGITAPAQAEQADVPVPA